MDEGERRYSIFGAPRKRAPFRDMKGNVRRHQAGQPHAARLKFRTPPRRRAICM